MLTGLLVFILLMMACKAPAGGNSANSNSANGEEEAAGELSSTPPFSTREPERYQATMIVNSNAGNSSSSMGQPEASTLQTFIARDGESRREDYELSPGIKVTDLEIPAGRFLLLPSKKLYAELKPGADGRMAIGPMPELPPDFSPDELINESHTEARYQKIGAEELNGRSVTKYRVLTKGADERVAIESLIWVDEALGMPVKSETFITGGEANGPKQSMEMRDIKETVDPQLFRLPGDYRRVEMKEILAQIFPAPERK